jgi:hypothetical protein
LTFCDAFLPYLPMTPTPYLAAAACARLRWRLR